MKALLKGGLFLALAWLIHSADAQDIRFKASSAKNPNQGAAIAPQVSPAPAQIGSNVRPVALQQPTPLDGSGAYAAPSFRPLALTVRGQAADDKSGLPEIIVGEGNPKTPKPLPKDEKKFVPPPPTPTPPSPIHESLGLMSDDCCYGTDCCASSLRCRGWCGPRSDDGCDRQGCWLSAEYLMWWQRSQGVPPLVTSSPAGTATINSGVLGANGTTVLYDSVSNHTRSGARFDAGMWLPHFCNLGIEGNFFFLGRAGSSATFGGNGDPQVARPIFNAITQLPGSELVSLNNPDRFLIGIVNVRDYSQVWGAEALLRRKWCCGPDYWIDFLFGYRHMSLSEGIDISENLQNFDPRTRLPAGNFLVRDSFQTRNQFNGMQIGLDSEYRFWSRMFLGVNSKVALGNVHQIVNIDGSTTFSNFGIPTATFPGGLLALPGTNIGSFNANRFGVLPEVGLKLGVDITDHLRLYAGYNFLYLNSVVRPGEQIDLRVNPNFQPTAIGPGAGGGPRVPAVLFRNSDYWAQGLSFGLMYQY